MVNASLTYEILLYLNSFYFGMFAACEVGIGVLKAVNLNYEAATLQMEIGLLLALCSVESLRIYLGRKGNLSEHGIPVILSVLLTIPSAAGVWYFFRWQNTILRLEYILCALMLALQVSEIFFAIMFTFTLCSAPSYN